MKDAIIGAIIGIEVGIIGPINTIPNRLIEEEIVTINKVQIDQEIQVVAVVQIVVNAVDVVEQSYSEHLCVSSICHNRIAY